MSIATSTTARSLIYSSVNVATTDSGMATAMISVARSFVTPVPVPHVPIHHVSWWHGLAPVEARAVGLDLVVEVVTRRVVLRGCYRVDRHDLFCSRDLDPPLA